MSEEDSWLATIEDFVDHRWTDAREALRKIDGTFVKKLESQVQFDELGLSAPWPFSDIERLPTRGLSTEWHRLLEACTDLILQLSIFEESTALLEVDTSGERSWVKAGRQVLLYIRSWVIVAQALAERVNGVIECTTKVYWDDLTTQNQLSKSFRSRVQQEVIQTLNARNEYVHANRSWAKGITEDKLWEGIVAVGLQPSRLYDQFVYPSQGELWMTGHYAGFANAAVAIRNRLGSILEDFEASIPSP